MDTKPYLLLTGASSQMGSALAQQLGASWAIILNGRDKGRLQSLLDSLPVEQPHVVWTYDLCSTDTMQNDFERFLHTHQITVGAFVHCAGTVPVQAARTIDAQAAGRVFSVNTVSAALLVALLMRKSINRVCLRHVIFISAILADFGTRGQSLYCASKAALDALARNFAVELAPNVRVNSIHLGGINSPSSAHILNNVERKTAVEREYPLGLGTNADVAAGVRFLLSEDARWITGQSLVMDGGRSVYFSFGEQT